MRNFKGHNFNRDLDIKEIAKIVRTELKETNCKFSVTISRYSMGRSLSIHLMEAPFDVFIDSSTESLSINQYHIDNNKNITKEAKEILKKAYNIVNSYNYDNSDSMTDYFDVNFYFNIEIGKWDKPFKKSIYLIK